MRSLLSITATIAVALSTLPINTLALSTTKIKHQPTSPNFNSPLLPLIDETNTHILLQQSTVEEETLERSTTSTANTNTKNDNNLSPFLQEMVDEQRELQMNVGKALDTLRKDYPDFLKRAPGKFIVIAVFHIYLSVCMLYMSLDGVLRPSYPSWYPLSNTPLPLSLSRLRLFNLPSLNNIKTIR